MRTINFRGKCTPDSRFAGEWVDGGCVQCTESDDVLIVSASSDNCTITCHVIPETVGQFTGLTDKNGVEIYEGDILEFDYLFCNEDGICTKKGVVSFENGTFCIDEDSDFSVYHAQWSSEEYGGIEIIGNIHDNPELLKN